VDKTFWDNVYQNKAEDSVSWYQELPASSLSVIDSLKLPISASIIDVGGGRSKLSEQLWSRGFQNITVLDISEVALLKMKESLNQKYQENTVQTLCSNITKAHFNQLFDLWHDRAVFISSLLLMIKKNVENLINSLNPNGYFLISTFSKNGPKKCSGLDICQYDREDLRLTFKDLKLLESTTYDHQTPMGTVQNFTSCLFQRRE